MVTEALQKVPIATRMKVREMTLDFASTMDWITRTNFPNAALTGDRFHIQQIVSEGVQEMRIELRRKAIDEENEKILSARKGGHGKPFRAETYGNGDTKKQLLARARYCLFKPSNKWRDSQKIRAEILFREFPELKKAYDLSMNFRSIFENAKSKEKAKERMKTWIQRVTDSTLKPLISAAQTVEANLGKILNYFPDGHNNAGAESFNAKLKGFRALVRGVRDVNFFLFRISTFYA